MPASRIAAFAILICCVNSTVVRGEETIRGVWQRDTGTARLQIAPCGDKFCGTIVWVRDKDSPTKVGMRVLYDIEPERPGNWRGKAFNPEDKQTYTGIVTLTGPRSMTISGCMVGKLLCRAMYWTRVGG